MSEITTKKKGFFGRMAERINDALFMHQEINEEMMDEIEEILITSDIGMETTMNIMEELREYIKVNMITLPKNVKKAIVEIIIRLIDKGERNRLSDKTPLVILMIGINGGGKTTTIAKLGNRLKKEGRTVMFAAADTFRAAASGQLKIFDNKDILYFKNPLRSGGHHPEERVDWGRLKYYSYIGTHAFYLTDFSEVGKY